ncbi:MAG: class I SAM-dependent rRNA methyltransferase [Puniceicoccales bacterium]|jgi:23S rRNA (cytosine1962-C5)-methyltransferase|nr:class I SAM-dependent rRNA methyltransferase [Puniceicoccales bacterium]
MEKFYLKHNVPAAVLKGHPWAFAGEIEPRRRRPDDGEGVELCDSRGHSLGSGIWSNHSQIAWRRYSRAVRPFDDAFVNWALGASLARRDKGSFRRLAWSEADHLPGLVIDQFGDILVVQALTAGADRALHCVCNWLRKNLSPREIVLRNDAPVRTREKLQLYVRTESGNPLPPDWVNIEGVDYHLDFLGGQKNGFYLDQREQHLRVARFAAGKRVLDAFCNQGGFGLQAARAGAASVLGLDSSEECVNAARRNAERNKMASTTHFLRANVFDWFTENRPFREPADGPLEAAPAPARNAPVFDLIILDPPPFARNRDSMDGALRGYKELNLRAMRLLAPGGILATYSCSQRVGIETFLGMLSDAASDAHRDARLIELATQPPDHPTLLTFPESHYLKGAILRME